jgi:SNF2 family DNA or RNA helicase
MLQREETDAEFCRGGVLADDMGLGKTFQTIGLLKNTPHRLTTLIICPPALVASWRDELTSCGFTVRELLRGGVWSVGASKGDGTGDLSASVWLTTYSKLCLYYEFIADMEFGRFILDEGHIIRNGRRTKRWKCAMHVTKSKQTSCRWILSATPIQNAATDWRNICWWLRLRCPQYEYEEAADTIMLRRTMAGLRDDIAALPEPPRFIIHDLHIRPEGETKMEANVFRALCDNLKSVIDQRAVSAILKLELYLRIQQFLVHPQIYVESMRAKFGHSFKRPDWTGSTTKWTAVMQEMQNGVRAAQAQIVFCNFRQEMDMVIHAATEMGAHAFYVRGGLTPDEIAAQIGGAKAAAAAGLPVVVVVQIVAGGAGINLQFCTRILFLSKHWNPAIVHQAVGRAVRIGQRARVEIHMFQVVDGVMDNIDRIMVRKHTAKITKARDICGTMYEGYAPVKDTFEPVEAEAEAEDEDDDQRLDDNVDVDAIAILPSPAIDAPTETTTENDDY